MVWRWCSYDNLVFKKLELAYSVVATWVNQNYNVDSEPLLVAQHLLFIELCKRQMILVITKELAMSNLGERIKGKAEEIYGDAKERLGDALDNEQMQAEGRATELKGEARQEAAKAAERLGGMADEAKGNLKQVAGDLLNNEQMQAEGIAEELKGEARRKANQ